MYEIAQKLVFGAALICFLLAFYNFIRFNHLYNEEAPINSSRKGLTNFVFGNFTAFFLPQQFSDRCIYYRNRFLSFMGLFLTLFATAIVLHEFFGSK